MPANKTKSGAISSAAKVLDPLSVGAVASHTGVNPAHSELREKFITLMNSMSLIFILVDRDLVIAYVSDAAKKGLPVTLHVGHLLHHDVVMDEARFAVYQRVFETGVGFTEWNYRMRDERFPRFHLRVIPVGDEVAICYEDAEAIEERESRVQRLEERFRSLADTMSRALVLINSQLEITYLNPLAEQLTGLEANNVLGKLAPQLADRLPSDLFPKIAHSIKHHESFTLNGRTFHAASGDCVLNLHGFFVGPELAILIEDVTEEARKNERIRSSEERFRTLSENLSLALVLLDSQRRITYWNRMAELAWPSNDGQSVIGKPAGDVLPFSDAALTALVQNAESLSEGGEQILRIVSDRDRHQPYAVYAVHTFLVGQEVGLLVKDITEQVEQSEEHTRKNTELSDLYNNAPCGYFSIVSDGKIVQMNRRMSEWLGHDSTERFVGTRLSDLLTTESRETFESELSASGLESPLTNIKLEFVKQDGGILHGLVNAIPIFDTTENKWCWRWTVVDISELRVAQHQIEDSMFFTELFNELGEGVLVSDKEGRIVRANRAAVRILGIPMEELTSLRQDSDIWKTISEDGTPIPLNELPGVTALRERRPVTNRELGVMRPDGEITWILISAAPLFDKSGNATGVILTFPEVSAAVTQRRMLKDLNDTLGVERDRANESNRLKSSFLANMSHEIRTPMTAILGFTDILSAELSGKVSDVHGAFLKSINVSGKRLLNLINDILDLSKIESGHLELQSEAIDLKGEIESALSPLTFMAGKKGLAIKFEPRPERTLIRGDRQRLGQVLTNIINNAIKFTREGSITVTVGENSPDEVVVSVADTGIGISPDFLPHLFEEFRQEHTGMTREFGGTGLGLAISQRLVSFMSGRIEVTSQEGVGTTFKLIFPKYSTSAPGTSAALASPSSRTQSLSNATIAPPKQEAPMEQKLPAAEFKSVLIVEDNVETQRLLEVYLKHNYRIFQAMNADEALEMFRRELPDAILMDINLPGNDGLWVVQQIRTGSVKPNIPIVAVTAFAMIGDRERCIKAGCNQYLSKPVTKREVLAALESVVSEAAKA